MRLRGWGQSDGREDRTFRYLFGCLGILILLIALPLGIAHIYYVRAIARELKAIAARRKPVTLAQAKPRPVPAAQNAALDYQGLLVDRAPSFPRTSSGAPVYYRSDEFVRAHSPAVRQELAQWLQDPQVQALLRQWQRAAAKQYCQFPGPPSEHEPPLQLGQFTGLLSALAEIRMMQGDPDAAERLLELGLRVCRHDAQTPSTVAQGAASAWRRNVFNGIEKTMALGDFPPEASGRLDRELARIHSHEDLGKALLAQRVDRFVAYGDANSYGSPLSWGRQLSPRMRQRNLLCGSYWFACGQIPAYRLRQQLTALRLGTMVLRQAGLPPGSRSTVTTWRMSQQPPGMDAAAGLANELGLVLSCDRVETEARLCRAALRLNDYHYLHHQYPPSLAALAQPLPLDPYTGRDFVYRRQGSSYLLYSVGGNQKDDGGNPGQDPTQGDVVWGN